MFDTTTAGRSSINFGKGAVTTDVGTVQTAIGAIKFEVVEAPTSFLLCMENNLKVYFDKWGHPWFHLGRAGHAIFLTETELRGLHRRFGHSTVERLSKFLEKANPGDVEREALRTVTKFCHHCQLNGTAPARFKFSLQGNKEFNYEIIVELMRIDGARFLPSMPAKDTWESLRMLWIDTYQGPPDIITYDAGTHFALNEFKAAP